MENQNRSRSSTTLLLTPRTSEFNLVLESSDSYNSVQNDSIDKQIIAEHRLNDPHDLDKTFSHLVCEINPDLSPDLRAKLDEISLENRSVSTKTKLDMGKFKGFTVKLDTDANLLIEKQRFSRRLVKIFSFGIN
jgi:hypothetical protein